jgi:glycosyltransferase involved in cell wall biosynthesis
VLPSTDGGAADDLQIVCVSSIPWSGAWTSRHALSAAWARSGLPVLFVDPPPNALRRERSVGGPAVDGVDVVVPGPRPPYGVLARSPRLAAAVIDLAARRLARFVAGAVAARPSRRVVLFNSVMPVLGYRVADAIRPHVSIYHRADELRYFPTATPLYVELERRVARGADLVVCVSEAVRAGISDVRPDAVVVPNGVDAAPFDGAAPDPRLAGLARPIVGLVGRIDERTDTSYLDAAAAGAGTLVLVGEVVGVTVPPGAVALGWCDRSRLPGLLAAMDVAIVCHRGDYPGDALKVYEYLAAGLPVVSTDFPGLASVRDSVRVVATPSGMTEAVREEAATRTPSGDAARRAVARSNSWDARADRLLSLALGASR